MTRTRLRNYSLKDKSEEDKQLFRKQRNKRVSLLRNADNTLIHLGIQ